MGRGTDGLHQKNENKAADVLSTSLKASGKSGEKIKQ
jgi:hypothetical protein